MPLHVMPGSRPEGSRAAPGRSVGRGPLLLLALLLLAYAGIGWVARANIGVIRGDELTYIGLSHAVEQGTYREVYRPSAPWHLKYPPGFPAMIAFARAITGQHVASVPAFNLAFVAVSFLLVFALARRAYGPWFGLAVLLPLVLNPGMLWVGGGYYSEALYMCFAMGALYATLRADEGDKRWVYAAIVLAQLSFLTRSAGLVLVAAIGLWILLRHRRWLAVLTFTASSAATVGGWALYVRLATSSVTTRSYLYDFNPEGFEKNPFSVVKVVMRLIASMRDYATNLLPYELSVPSIPGTSLDNLVTLAILAALLPVGLVVLWKHSRASAMYVVLYGAMVIVFPFVGSRLLEPIIPLVMLALLLGAWRVADRVPRRAGVAGLAVVLGLLTLGGARGAAKSVEAMRDCNRAEVINGVGCYSEPTRDFVQATEFVRRNLPADSYSIAWRATAIYFLTGHPSESALLVEQIPPGTLADTLRSRHIRYAILTANSGFETMFFADALEDSCEGFRLARRVSLGTIVLEAAPATVAADDACREITRFRTTFPRPGNDLFPRKPLPRRSGPLPAVVTDSAASGQRQSVGASDAPHMAPAR